MISDLNLATSVGEFRASLTAWRRLEGGMVRGHSVARSQVTGNHDHDPLLKLVQNIPDLLSSRVDERVKSIDNE